MNSIDARTLGQCISSFTVGSSVVSGFDNVAQDYEKVRPNYPSEIVNIFLEHLKLTKSNSICDLACGTGKLTKALFDKGYTNLVAIDPADDMVATCASLVPQVVVKKGTAEAIPTPANSFDAVVVGTAFHWFDGVKALNEIARVLTVDGRVGLIWNMLNPEITWVKKLRDLLEVGDQPNRNHDSVNWQRAFELDPRFSLLEHQVKRYTLKATPKAVVDCILSFKAAGNMSDEQIKGITKEAFEILAQDARTANKTEIDIPFRVEMYWTVKVKEASRSTIELANNGVTFVQLPMFHSHAELHKKALEGIIGDVTQSADLPIIDFAQEGQVAKRDVVPKRSRNEFEENPRPA